MNNEKRFVLFIILMSIWMLGFPYVMRLPGINPPPKEPVPPAAAAVEAEKKAQPGDEAKEPAKDAVAKAEEKAKAGPAAVAPKKPEVPLVEEGELVLGNEGDT